MHCARGDIEESDAVHGRNACLSRAWQARPDRIRPCARRGAGIIRLNGQAIGPARRTATLPCATAQVEQAPPALGGLACLLAANGTFRLDRGAVHGWRLGWLAGEHAPSSAATLPRLARRIAPAVASA